MRKWRVLTGLPLVIVASIAMFAWAAKSLVLAIICTALAIGLLVLFIWLYRRPSLYPDLLREVAGKYFERNGFCFSMLAKGAGGTCDLVIHYQNRYENPGQSVVVINRPRRSFRMAPSLSVSIGFEFEGGEFGVTRIPWAVSPEMSGRKETFELAANVRYPRGKGKMMRYRDGLRVGSARGASWQVAGTVAAAMAGVIVISRPARIQLKYPAGVLGPVPENAPIVKEVLWRPGQTYGQPGSILPA